MLRNKKTRFLVGVLFFISISVFSQIDNEIWTGINFEKKLSKKIRIGLNNQFRLNENFSQPKKMFSELGLSYKFNQYVSSSFRYRFTSRFQKKDRARWTAILKMKYKIKPLDLTPSYRFRYQNEDQFNSNKEINVMRHKFALGYNMTKLVAPFVSYETFYRFNQINEFSNYRATIGLKWNLPNKWSISTYYRIDKDLNVFPESGSKIVAILFDKRLGKKKKKDKK